MSHSTRLTIYMSRHSSNCSRLSTSQLSTNSLKVSQCSSNYLYVSQYRSNCAPLTVYMAHHIPFDWLYMYFTALAWPHLFIHPYVSSVRLSLSLAALVLTAPDFLFILLITPVRLSKCLITLVSPYSSWPHLTFYSYVSSHLSNGLYSS